LPASQLRIPELDRRTVRARFEERFSSKRMAQDYVRCYEAVAAANRHVTSRRHEAGLRVDPSHLVRPETSLTKTRRRQCIGSSVEDA